jgi:hypothetical protein
MINENFQMKKMIFRKKEYRRKKISMVYYGSMMLITALMTATSTIYAQPSNLITVKANQIKADVAPTMWGVFFEDINMGADGGIYAS